MTHHPKRVLWTQGMLMCPQHLQQHDRFVEHAREARLMGVFPDAWGISSLSVDERGLARGSLDVRQLEATLPSGLMLSVGGSVAALPHERSALSRPIDAQSWPAHQAVDVYVAVARLQDGAANVALEGPAQPHQRYVACRHLVAEHSQGATPAVSVAFAEPHVQLLLGHELTGDVEALRIGRLARDGSGALSWVHRDVPPCLQLGASPFVMQQLHHLLTILEARRVHLAGLCRHRRAAAHALQVVDVLQLSQLAAVQSALPALRHLVEAPQTSPRLGALLLAQAVGQLSILAPDVAFPSLPGVQHIELTAFFVAAFAALEQLLAADGQVPHEALTLQAGPDEVFACGSLPAAWRDDASWLLAVAGPGATPELAERWRRFARAAAASQLPQLIRVAAEGVPLSIVERPPQGVPWRPELLYLALDTGHPSWRDVRQDGALAVALPPGLAASETELTLLMVPRAQP